MKTLRQLLVASVLTLALSVPALAGEISTMVVPPPPPPPTAPGEITTMVAQPTTDGEISTGAPGQIDTPESEASATVLSLLQTVLSLF
jgi:hypothetical protein